MSDCSYCAGLHAVLLCVVFLLLQVQHVCVLNTLPGLFFLNHNNNQNPAAALFCLRPTCEISSLSILNVNYWFSFL